MEKGEERIDTVRLLILRVKIEVVLFIFICLPILKDKMQCEHCK